MQARELLVMIRYGECLASPSTRRPVTKWIKHPVGKLSILCEVADYSVEVTGIRRLLWKFLLQ